MHTLLLIAAAFAAGAMNAMAGGGSFLTFPALIFAGIPPVQANATNTVALFPASLASAWAYRRDFPRIERMGTTALIGISVVGGGLGALLLLYTPEQTFSALVPWLLLMATVLFAGGRRFIPFLRRHLSIGPLAVALIQFLIALYGGYFGGAIGILMLALFGLFGLTDINAMNGLKSLLAGVLNAVAVIFFAAAGAVHWQPALLMMVCGIAGGYTGARIARRMNPEHVRALIIAVGSTMTAIFFFRG